MDADILIHNISNLYTMTGEEMGRQSNASIAFKNGRIYYIGPSKHAPSAEIVFQGERCVGLPGLVDCHTHAVWAGSRADEFQKRLAGASYSDILQSGGGILNTVQQTRAASLEELTASCRARLISMLINGITTVEVKSGYGLNPQTEERLLQAIHNAAGPMNVVPTFLGAHAIPREYRENREAYVQQIITEQLPICAPYAKAIDVYCDIGAFTLEESVRILAAGQKEGLRIRAHAEQVTHTGIAGAAAKMGATCVDHLEHLSAADIAEMAEHNTVAVLLPGAQLYLRDTPPPIAKIREAGVAMAIATDLNPGSSPVHDLWTCATLSCLLQGTTVQEAVLGITKNAGRALGEAKLGWLGEESAADFTLYLPPAGENPTVESLTQHMGGRLTMVLVCNGQVAYHHPAWSPLVQPA